MSVECSADNGNAAMMGQTGTGHTVQARTLADLRMLLDSAAEGLCSIDRQGAIILCNASFLRMTGFRRNDEVLGKDLRRLIRHSRTDGSSLHGDCPILKTAQTGLHAHVTDQVFYRADGTSFPVEYWVRPIIREGRIEGAACTFVDITERKQAEARQQLLNHELVHRVKNTLAVVQAIVGQTLRNSGAPRDAIQAIGARLVALSRAHDVLMRTRWDEAPIADVIASGMAVHGSENSRVRLDGPRIDVGPRAALALTMALHELCTNAIKYGALSSNSGNVVVTWLLGGRGSDARFQLRWKESGGPLVTAPARTGFGSWIIGEHCQSELEGVAVLSFPPDGAEWTLDAPMRSMAK